MVWTNTQIRVLHKLWSSYMHHWCTMYFCSHIICSFESDINPHPRKHIAASFCICSAVLRCTHLFKQLGSYVTVHWRHTISVRRECDLFNSLFLDTRLLCVAWRCDWRSTTFNPNSPTTRSPHWNGVYKLYILWLIIMKYSKIVPYNTYNYINLIFILYIYIYDILSDLIPRGRS